VSLQIGLQDFQMVNGQLVEVKFIVI
jgi:hypothetical protein